jgi:hypothetical protein
MIVADLCLGGGGDGLTGAAGLSFNFTGVEQACEPEELNSWRVLHSLLPWQPLVFSLLVSLGVHGSDI